MSQLFPVLCAWCSGVIGYIATAYSHGICPACSEAVLKEARASRSAS